VTDDEKLAFNFLFGRRVGAPGGLTKPAYLKGDDELRARAALVRLLRSRRALLPLIRHGLANLLDTDAPAPDDRQFLIRYRSKGGPSQDFAHYKIALFVNALGWKKTEAAVQAAMTEFKVDRKTVYKARKEYKEYFRIFNEVHTKAKAVTE
jgi:hypothetical protein